MTMDLGNSAASSQSPGEIAAVPAPADAASEQQMIQAGPGLGARAIAAVGRGCKKSVWLVWAGLVKIVPGARRKAIGHLWWMLPLVMLMGVIFPPLRLNVVEAVPQGYQVSLLAALIVEMVIIGVWIVSEFFIVSDQATSVRRLRLNSAVSTLIGLGLTGLCAWLLARNSLPWGFVVPFVGGVIDAFISGDRAINNAAQKPLVQSAPARN